MSDIAGDNYLTNTTQQDRLYTSDMSLMKMQGGNYAEKDLLVKQSESGGPFSSGKYGGARDW